jgi:glucose-6-phosphate isomerase
MIEVDVRRQDFGEISQDLMRVSREIVPDFARWTPDLAEVEMQAAPYRRFRNVILIGSGGARTSFNAFYRALGSPAGPRFEFLTTVDPDRICELKSRHSPSDTLVLAVSKSGTNTTVLEALFAFGSYTTVVVTSDNGNVLQQVAKLYGWDCVYYPPETDFPFLDDRCTGLTASGLFPAAIAGIDVAGLFRGGKAMYDLCAPSVPAEENPALRLAAGLWLLDKQGFTEVFTAVYSSRLSGFLPLLTQLIHETSCKEGKGQTLFGDEGPECQHHTNQRFFGGRKNVLGMFLTAGCDERASELVVVPEELQSLPLRTGVLGDLAGVPYSKSLHYEYEGTVQDALKSGIPVVDVRLDRVSPQSVGELLALAQYLAFYSATLREVVAFGQPQVEKSKEISFELRRKHSSHRRATSEGAVK